ncbi:unnamed protein product [Enterobius vermicularis]|uniref:RICTOR_N domain-containing protein n=1 Tax=Enterobius vermicularis TaxID=51028 RepID=A0A0N4VQ51_ENTVE|nr:unnamed protein product [Enterobius vermicularis]
MSSGVSNSVRKTSGVQDRIPKVSVTGIKKSLSGRKFENFESFQSGSFNQKGQPDPKEGVLKFAEVESTPLLRDVTYLNELCKSILRLVCVNEKILNILLSLQVDLFISRALDLNAHNDEERIEALKLSAVMLQVYNRSVRKSRGSVECESYTSREIPGIRTSLFPKSVLLPIFLIAKSAFSEMEEDVSQRKNDKLALPCFAVFLETAVNDPFLVIDVAGTGWIVDALLIPNNKWVSVLVCRILCLWLDCPRLRTEAKLNTVLEQLFAPIVEIGFFQSVTVGELKASEERVQNILDSCFEVLLNLLTTWSGLYSCVSSDRYGKTIVASPFRLLQYLGSGTVVNKVLKKMRDLVVNLCCELTDCPYAGKSFESWIDAVHYYSSKDFPDPYKCSLREDFILAEHKYSLSHSQEILKKVDLLKSFRSLALFFLVDAGVLQVILRNQEIFQKLKLI